MSKNEEVIAILQKHFESAVDRQANAALMDAIFYGSGEIQVEYDKLLKQDKESQKMTDTKKLTGREAVIALMQGKKIFRHAKYLGTDETYRMLVDVSSDKQSFMWTAKDYSAKPFSLDLVLAHDDWELVPDPMVWEGEADALLINKPNNPPLLTSFALFPHFTDLPDLGEKIHYFAGKRVKVRVEEILE